MEMFKRVLVALDHTIFDRELMAFASYFARLTHPEKLYFVHIDRNLEIPDYLQSAFDNQAEVYLPKDELLKQDLEKTIDRYFKNDLNVPVSVEIREGKPLQELLHWIKVKKIDLAIVGNKKLSEGSGITANKLAREAPCSMLFVPHGQKFPPGQLIVPFDFSTSAGIALKTALQLSTDTGPVPVKVLHVFDVPVMHRHELTGNFGEVVKKVREFKKQSFQKFLDKEGLNSFGISVEMIENSTGKTAHHLNNSISEEENAMVLVGDKDHSLLSSFLLGSITEKLLALNNTVPILVRKSRRI